ncbi:MAG: outer membrane protein assembly factor BamC [Acidovorax sp.]|uniref:outer membrane protein assembly factor BamC n=1 Tax=Acidovorax sp. TaxID=1872122 RepID=UPI0039E480DA
MNAAAATPRLSLLALALALSACSALEGDKIDYKSAGKGPSLEVPPDLTQLSRDSRYTIPGSGPVSAAALQAGQASQPTGTSNAAAQVLGDVRIERDGNQRWLVISRPADKLWEPVREFWQESGFNLEKADANVGIMETDWAENRAKLPQDFIRSTLGKVLDSLYSTGERDKFRTRLERNASGGTDIYITHRGMVEVYSNTAKDTTIWQPRPSDPELETEFLRRLMVKLGVSQEQSKAIAASAPAQRAQSARMATVNNQPVLQLDEGFDRAWRRVGLALDRTGFTVEDRNRNEGTYYVRYVEPTDKKEPGFFGKLFSSSPAVPPLKYRIVVRSQGESTTVSVHNEAGAPESSANAERIVRVIADDLK